MIDKCLMGYSREFIDYITKYQDDFYIDQETFESLLPSKQLILLDEEQFKKCVEETAGCFVSYIELDFPTGSSKRLYYPLSYYLTYELMESGIESLERYPEELSYALRKSYMIDGDVSKEEKIYKATFAKSDFILGTKKYQKKLSRKK